MTKKPVKVIICGSRSFDDYIFLEQTVKSVFRDLTQQGILYGSPVNDEELIEIVSGGAQGADILGEWFANHYGLKTKVMLADWDNKGKKAGLIRNCEMVDYIASSDCYGVVLAFWDGQSKGTQHCFNYAKDKDLDVRIKLFRKVGTNE